MPVGRGRRNCVLKRPREHGASALNARLLPNLMHDCPLDRCRASSLHLAAPSSAEDGLLTFWGGLGRHKDQE